MSKKLFLFLVILLLCRKHIYAQSAPALELSVSSGALRQQNFKQSIHFEYINGEIFLIVTINGKDYNFIYDTGALTVLSREAVQDMSMEETGFINTSDGKNTVERNSTYNIDSLQLAGITFYNILCVAIDTKPISKLLGKRVDGIFGANIMKLCTWQITFFDTSLTFSDHTIVPGASSIACNFLEGDNGSPYLNMQYGDTAFLVEFDTGSNNPITFDESVFFKQSVRHHIPYATLYGNLERTVYKGVYAKEYRALCNDLILDGNLLTNAIVNVRALNHAIPTMGTSFMKNFNVILDWKYHKLYMEKIADTLDDKFTKTIGLSPTITEDKLTVALVWKNSRAEEYGIHPGNEILAINGEKTVGLTDERYNELINSLRKLQRVQLKIKNAENMVHEYTLDRYDVLRP